MAIYMKLGGIPGAATDSLHAGWIPLLSATVGPNRHIHHPVGR